MTICFGIVPSVAGQSWRSNKYESAFFFAGLFAVRYRSGISRAYRSANKMEVRFMARRRDAKLLFSA